MEKNIFIFDQNKCVGCHACLVACINENGFQLNDQWRNIHNSNTNHYPDLPLFYLSLACNHCDDAPCLKNCPAQAYSRDEKTGAIIHHPEKCIGCKYCTWACPYDAPKFNPKKGIIEKCTFCNHRIEENLKPACANLCPTGALDFTQMEFTKEEALKSSPVPVKVGSSLKMERLRNRQGPEIDQELFKNQDKDYIKKKKHSKIAVKEECPLIIFTLLCTAAVAFYSTGKTEMFNSIQKFIFVSLGFVGAFLSTSHLGKKFRAWRSITNIKNSWLSREILSFGLFYLGVFIDFYIIKIPVWIPALIGFVLLLAIDMLYRLAKWEWPIKIHSANTLLIGLTLTAFLMDYKLVVVFLVSCRLTLYIYRKYISRKYILISVLRMLSLMFSIILSYYDAYYAGITFLIIGEIIDRIEFYTELKVPLPQTEIQIK